MDKNNADTRRRSSYTREFKLSVIAFYYHTANKNFSSTAREFKLDRKQVRDWVNSEFAISEQNRGQRARRWTPALYPVMEDQLYYEFKKARAVGQRVKSWWFYTRGKQILAEMHPGNTFKFSKNWFYWFQKRHNISLRQKTHAAQKDPSSLLNKITEFHT